MEQHWATRNVASGPSFADSSLIDRASGSRKLPEFINDSYLGTRLANRPYSNALEVPAQRNEFAASYRYRPLCV